MEELIYDIGFHKGEDTLFYLLKGYNVVAVDADIELIEEGKSSFKEYIDNGRLILLNYAITNESDEDINFFISQNTLWNSTNGAVASRQGNKTLKKKVRSKRLDDLFREYGMPFYCKIDIEGNELNALHGAQRMLDEGKIDVIQMEFGGCNIDSRTYFRDFWNLLSAKYKVYRVLLDGVEEITEYGDILEIFFCTNYLFVRK